MQKTQNHYFDTEKRKEIGWYFFMDYTYPEEVGKKIYPRQRKNKGQYVGKLLDAWKKAKYMEKSSGIKIINKNKSGEKYKTKHIHYRLNLDPFYDYLKNNYKLDFQDSLRKEIGLFFNTPNVRNFLFYFSQEKGTTEFRFNFYGAIAEFMYQLYDHIGDNRFIKNYFKRRPDLLKRYFDLDLVKAYAEATQNHKQHFSGLHYLNRLIKEIKQGKSCFW